MHQQPWKSSHQSTSGAAAAAPAHSQVATRRTGGAQSEKGGASSVALARPTETSIKLAAHSPSRIPEGAKITQNVIQIYGSGLLGYPRGEWPLASPTAGIKKCRLPGRGGDRGGGQGPVGRSPAGLWGPQARGLRKKGLEVPGRERRGCLTTIFLDRMQGLVSVGLGTLTDEG